MENDIKELQLLRGDEVSLVPIVDGICRFTCVCTDSCAGGPTILSGVARFAPRLAKAVNRPLISQRRYC
jgi:hypothetical protein